MMAPTLELKDCIPIAPDRSAVGKSSSGHTYTMENAEVIAVFPIIACEVIISTFEHASDKCGSLLPTPREGRWMVVPWTLRYGGGP